MVIEVQVQPHDAEWARRFMQEAQNLRALWGANLVAAHHIGSTAIPSIVAKPIVDMLVEVRSTALLDERVPQMEASGYQALGEYGLPGRRYFRKENPDGSRSHHIHVYETGSPEIHRHLAFRNYLLAHPVLADEYSALKQRLAADHPHDAQAYMDGKAPFIREVEARAIAWARPTDGFGAPTGDTL